MREKALASLNGIDESRGAAFVFSLIVALLPGIIYPVVAVYALSIQRQGGVPVSDKRDSARSLLKLKIKRVEKYFQ